MYKWNTKKYQGNKLGKVASAEKLIKTVRDLFKKLALGEGDVNWIGEAIK